MTHRNRVRRPRAAFTLIELLVVILIIAILVSLTTVAVMKVITKGPQLQTRVEIGQLEGALANAKGNFNNVSYIPSRLKLREDNAYNTADVDEQRTVIWLQQAFGKRINLTPNPGNLVHDWNGDGVLTPGPLTLNGAQCLVFALGGIPSPPGSNPPSCNGFSTNPQFPAALGGTRKGPFFEFASNRLVAGPGNFLVYLDNYGKNQPYLYMSSFSGSNTYNFGNNSDCGGLLAPAYGVTPYMSSATRFVNANTFQIISAGADGLFGPGTGWTPGGGYATPGPGSDDQANFSGSLLGDPQS